MVCVQLTILLYYTAIYTQEKMYLYVLMYIIIYWLHTAFAAAPSQLAEDLGLPDYQPRKLHLKKVLFNIIITDVWLLILSKIPNVA